MRSSARARQPDPARTPSRRPASAPTSAPTSRKNADIQASVGYVSSDTRFVENDNSFLTDHRAAARRATHLPDDASGWFFTPAAAVRRAGDPEHQAVHRRAHRQLAARPAGSPPGPPSATTSPTGTTSSSSRPARSRRLRPEQRRGSSRTTGSRSRQTSVDLAATARFKLSPQPGRKTSVGGQFFRDLQTSNFALGQWPAGGLRHDRRRGQRPRRQTASPSPARIGTYVEEEIGLKERLFVTGAVRFDDNSAFGQNFNATDVPQGQRLVAALRGAVLATSASSTPSGCAAPSGPRASSPAPPTPASSSAR